MPNTRFTFSFSCLSSSCNWAIRCWSCVRSKVISLFLFSTSNMRASAFWRRPRSCSSFSCISMKLNESISKFPTKVYTRLCYIFLTIDSCLWYQGFLCCFIKQLGIFLFIIKLPLLNDQLKTVTKIIITQTCFCVNKLAILPGIKMFCRVYNHEYVSSYFWINILHWSVFLLLVCFLLGPFWH